MDVDTLMNSRGEWGHNMIPKGNFSEEIRPGNRGGNTPYDSTSNGNNNREHNTPSLAQRGRGGAPPAQGGAPHTLATERGP